MEKQKTCSKCKTTFYNDHIANNFYRDLRKPDGFNYQCKGCKKKYERKDLARERFLRSYYNNKDKCSARLKARRKWGAHKRDCAVLGCEHKASELAHIDYLLPLDVLPLCKKHHHLLDKRSFVSK